MTNLISFTILIMRCQHSSKEHRVQNEQYFVKRFAQFLFLAIFVGLCVHFFHIPVRGKYCRRSVLLILLGVAVVYSVVISANLRRQKQININRQICFIAQKSQLRIRHILYLLLWKVIIYNNLTLNKSIGRTRCIKALKPTRHEECSSLN